MQSPDHDANPNLDADEGGDTDLGNDTEGDLDEARRGYLALGETLLLRSL